MNLSLIVEELAKKLRKIDLKNYLIWQEKVVETKLMENGKHSLSNATLLAL